MRRARPLPVLISLAGAAFLLFAYIDLYGGWSTATGAVLLVAGALAFAFVDDRPESVPERRRD